MPFYIALESLDYVTFFLVQYLCYNRIMNFQGRLILLYQIMQSPLYIVNSQYILFIGHSIIAYLPCFLTLFYSIVHLFMVELIEQICNIEKLLH